MEKKTKKVVKVVKPAKAVKPVKKVSAEKPAKPVKVVKPVKVKVARVKKNAHPPIAHGVGRRKSAVARVWLYTGEHEILVNDRPAANYFSTDGARLDVMRPYAVAPQMAQYRVQATVTGGGLMAQAGAVRLATARALVEAHAQLRPIMRQHGLLTVDSRIKERKKYGRKAARRGFQFVKR